MLSIVVNMVQNAVDREAVLMSVRCASTCLLPTSCLQSLSPVLAGSKWSSEPSMLCWTLIDTSVDTLCDWFIDMLLE